MKTTIFLLALLFAYAKCDTLSEAKVAWPSFENFTTVENNGYIDTTCTEKPGGYCILKSVEILQDITEENQLTIDYVIKEYDGWRDVGRRITRTDHENVPFCKPFESRNEESSILKLLRLAMKLPDEGCPVTKQTNDVSSIFSTSSVYLDSGIYKCQHYFIEFTIKNSNSEEIASAYLVLFSRDYYCDYGESLLY